MEQKKSSAGSILKQNRELVPYFILAIIISFCLPLGIFEGSHPYYGLYFVSFFYYIGMFSSFDLISSIAIFFPLIFVAAVFRFWLPIDVLQYTMGRIGRIRICVMILLADAHIFTVLLLVFGLQYWYYPAFPLPLASLASIPLFLKSSKYSKARVAQ